MSEREQADWLKAKLRKAAADVSANYGLRRALLNVAAYMRDCEAAALNKVLSA